MKANHNWTMDNHGNPKAGVNISSSKNESKSQHQGGSIRDQTSWCKYQ